MIARLCQNMETQTHQSYPRVLFAVVVIDVCLNQKAWINDMHKHCTCIVIMVQRDAAHATTRQVWGKKTDSHMTYDEDSIT